MAPIVYLDTNVFIRLKEDFGEVPDRLIGLLAAAMNRSSARMATCELTLAELLTQPFALQREDLIEQYQNWILPSDWLQVVPVDRPTLTAAAILRSTYKSVKLPDAIHVAAAIGVGCRYFLTADEGLKGTYRLAVTRYGFQRVSEDVTVVRPDLDTISRIESEF